MGLWDNIATGNTPESRPKVPTARRHYLGLDVPARSRVTPADDQNTQEATGTKTRPALTAQSPSIGSVVTALHTMALDSTGKPRAVEKDALRLHVESLGGTGLSSRHRCTVLSAGRSNNESPATSSRYGTGPKGSPSASRRARSSEACGRNFPWRR